MPEQILSRLALALSYLRSASGWSKTRLARALGLADESLISAYERGAKVLTREQLDTLVEPLGHPPEAVDVLLFAHGLIFPEPQAEAPSPVALSPEETRTVDRAAMAGGWTAGQAAARALRAELIRRKRQGKAEAAKQEAEELFPGLMAATPQERSGLVKAFPDYWNWALAVRVCEESVKRAAHKASEALELADLALSIAERAPGEERWRSRLKGYCWAHVANGRRVANDLSGADAAFRSAWDLWRARDRSELDSLPEWRLPLLEASLRRDERRFLEALKLLDQARVAAAGNPHATGRILLTQEYVFLEMGDIRNALATLAKAAPFVLISGDARLVFSLRFKSAHHLCRLEQFEEAAKLLPQVRELAIHQANDLDVIRVGWLAAKVSAGQGQHEEAISSLEQVCKDFTVRKLPYDAALSSLDMAMPLLKEGRRPEVKKLAVAMGWIFAAKGIQREALAALTIFCDAALQDSATEELARKVIAELERLRLSAS